MRKPIIGTGVLVVFVVMSAVALIAASQGSTVHAHAQSVRETGSVTPGTIQTNPTIATYPPQAGFDPYTASEAALRTHGYPPRPSAGPALAMWKDAISHAIHYEPPNPIPSSVVHGPVRSSRALWSGTNQYSGNWAGFIMPQAALGNNNLYYTFAKWTQPSVSGDSHYTNYQNAPDTSFWGGTGVSQLVQAGADSIATSTPQYRFWTEDYPLGTVWEGPVVRPGDTVGEAEQYSGSLCNNCGGTATFWLENYTTGYYQSFTNSAPYPGWQAANFINERLGSYYLPKFGSTVFTSCTTNNGSGIYWYLTTSNNNRVYMTTNGSSSGTVMSDPGAVNNSTNGFTDTWKNAGP